MEIIIAIVVRGLLHVLAHALTPPLNFDHIQSLPFFVSDLNS